MQVVWFKRDLRVADHRPLVQAAQRGAVLPLYIVEPDYWQQPDASGRQWAFVRESLAELRDELSVLGAPLVIRTGRVTDVLDALHRESPLSALWSHQETGNDWTFRRDRAVADWCARHSMPWHEIRQHGIERGRSHRSGWAGRWDRFMAEPLTPPPGSLRGVAGISSDALPTAAELALSDDPCPDRQAGGRRAGIDTIESFLQRRGAGYRTAMSSPLTAETGCSRVSPHLAWGTLSLREVTQATWQQQERLAAFPRSAAPSWTGSLKSFNGRLHWHCHFMQKLEDEPRIEFENMHTAYDGLRQRDPGHVFLAAWQRGETGFPFVDACMRALDASGWINFRMRAMLMAVASYHLWLDWRDTGAHLARLFTDYEPGIHWPQVQMQSGTTGINALRIYNPVKQGYDQDPDGTFVRRWLPELADVPSAFIHEPWKSPVADSILGKRYPYPIVNHIDAARIAKQRLAQVRRNVAHDKEAKSVYAKHGSRRRSGQSTAGVNSRQRNLDFFDPEQMT